MPEDNWNDLGDETEQEEADEEQSVSNFQQFAGLAVAGSQDQASDTTAPFTVAQLVTQMGRVVATDQGADNGQIATRSSEPQEPNIGQIPDSFQKSAIHIHPVAPLIQQLSILMDGIMDPGGRAGFVDRLLLTPIFLTLRSYHAFPRESRTPHLLMMQDSDTDPGQRTNVVVRMSGINLRNGVVRRIINGLLTASLINCVQPMERQNPSRRRMDFKLCCLNLV